MTEGYRCDRCGEWNESPGSQAHLELKVIGRPMHATYSENPDLCDGCRQDFAAFMEGSA